MKIIKYMMQVLVVGSLLTSCVEDADVTAYLTERPTEQCGSGRP